MKADVGTSRRKLVIHLILPREKGRDDCTWPDEDRKVGVNPRHPLESANLPAEQDTGAAIRAAASAQEIPDGLFVVADSTNEIAHLRDEAHLRDRGCGRAGLWKH